MWVGNIISMMNESRRVETKASTPNYSLFGNKMKTSKSTILESVGKFGEFGCNCIWHKKFHFQSLYKIIVLNFLYGFGCMIRIKIVTCLWEIIQSFRKYSRSLLSFLILILIKNIYLMHDVPVLTETRSVHQFDSRLWSKCPWVRWSAFTDAFF